MKTVSSAPAAVASAPSAFSISSFVDLAGCTLRVLLGLLQRDRRCARAGRRAGRTRDPRASPPIGGTVSPCSGSPARPTITATCVFSAFVEAGRAEEETERGTPQQTRRQRIEPALHASPARRRNAHSANINPSSAISTIGMCHSSRSSIVVTPRPVYWRSSASPVSLPAV